ncbi:DUF4870 domain-containing protein [Gryllotalpicola reticulitermitis]|uniref:DUF4870 domain-containing protein n=1 Tax=Gryllotalpicola reticulitermitis TaxID=1184153 RepID=A0ABV8QAP5_9MICO
MSYTPPPAEPFRPETERQWSVLVHVIAGGLNLVTGGLFTGLIAAIIAFILLRGRGPFVRSHAATTLNFQITMIIAEIIGLILIFVLVGWFILAAVWVVNIVFSIQGALAAGRGRAYTYPISIPIFK